MKAPFPYFGGKSKVANIVWAALGDCPNYVEPFAGSLAVLLARPHPSRLETVNDKDCMIANFWRALSKNPDAVTEHADWPVNEVDLEARHYWLVQQKESLREKLGNPEWYDAKIAGWWVWGISCWIGSGWCNGKGPWNYDGESWQKGDGDGVGIRRKLPHLGGSNGIHAIAGISRQLPHLRGSNGIHAIAGISRQLPHLGGDKGIHAANRGPLLEYMQALAERLRRVRVCCGDWSRICGPSVTHYNGLTGVFLDPPYANAERTDGLYAEDCGNVAADVTDWAMEQGHNPKMRIVVAGYEIEHKYLEMAGWTTHRWKANGGMGAGRDGRGDANQHRETLWFSPHCLAPETQGDLLLT
jgi:hypothetical protein